MDATQAQEFKQAIDTLNANVNTQMEARNTREANILAELEKTKTALAAAEANIVTLQQNYTSSDDLVKAIADAKEEDKGRHAEMLSVMQSNNQEFLMDRSGYTPDETREGVLANLGIRSPARDSLNVKMQHDIKVAAMDPEIRKLDREYQATFQDYLRAGDWNGSPERAKALAEGNKLQAAINEAGKKLFPTVYMAEITSDTPSTGGLVIPLPIQQDVIMRHVRLDSVRSMSRVIQLSGPGSTLKFPIQKTRATVTWADTRKAIERTGVPTFGFVDLALKSIAAKIGVERHMMADAPQFIMNAIDQDLGQALRDGQNDEFLNGTSPDRPRGILSSDFADDAAFADRKVTLARVKTGAASGFPTGSGSQYPAKVIIDAIFKMPASKRAPGAAFIFHPTSLSRLMVLTDADGNTIWQNPLVAGTPGTLSGYAVLEDEWMPTFAANAYFGLFKARGAYTIIEKGGMTIRVNDLTEDHEVVTTWEGRIDGGVTDPWAIVGLQVAA